MIFIGGLVAFAIMAGIIYMAINKKSDFKTRIASLVALAIMIVTVIICVVMIFSGDTVVVDYSNLIVGEPPQTKTSGSDEAAAIIIMLVFLIAIFAIIVILSLREHSKHAPKKPGINDKSAGNFDF